MELTTEERAEMASELLASLDDAHDLDADQAWAEEIERRVRDSLSGTGNSRDLKDALADIRTRLRAGG